MTTSHLKYIALIAISALIVSALIVFVQMRTPGPAASGIVAENFGGPFTLTDYAGHTVTDKDFSGRWRLILATISQRLTFRKAG